MASDGDTTRALGDASASAPPLTPGALVGAWRVTRHLATGGFGTVYDVAHASSGQRGALKVLHAHMLASSEMVARMVREANVIARLRHPNVVELVDAGVLAGGQPYLVMEYLEGQDLAARIAQRGRCAPAEALAILTPLCAAVATAHDHGVIHRDIKASNVFVCGDGADARIVLLDFGIAKLLDVGGADLTSSRQALGTPSSMAPEQIRGDVIDGRADVYALGALAYHLLTGRMPFEDASMTMSQYLHLHAARPRPSSLAPLGTGIDEVVVKAMAVDRERRHADPLALLAALRSAILGAEADEVREVDGVAIRVAAWRLGDGYDDAVLDDLDAVLALADATLSSHGFQFVRDLGDASLFFAAHVASEPARVAARAVAEALAARAGRHPEVAHAVWVHRGAARVAGGRLVGGALHDPASWGLPQDREGLWVTPAAGADG